MKVHYKVQDFNVEYLYLYAYTPLQMFLTFHFMTIRNACCISDALIHPWLYRVIQSEWDGYYFEFPVTWSSYNSGITSHAWRNTSSFASKCPICALCFTLRNIQAILKFLPSARYIVAVASEIRPRSSAQGLWQHCYIALGRNFIITLTFIS